MGTDYKKARTFAISIPDADNIKSLIVDVRLFNHNHYLCLFLWKKGGRRGP